MSSTVKLSDEQINAVDHLMSIVASGKPTASMGGYAGTGKSTVIKHLHEHDLKDYSVCAFTGKAASVLRKKGVATASTIHSLIYDVKKDEHGIPIRVNGSMVFELKPSLDCEGILVDEASMVSRELHGDLLKFGLPVIFVGDHGQLEPVGEGVNLMAKPDVTLETIHRNAGEIAFFCEHVRTGYRPASWSSQGKVRFISKYQADRHFTKVDQIICAYNRTRVEINREVREQLGFRPDWPSVGDRVMCLKNNKKNGLFNGLQGRIKTLNEQPRNRMTFEQDGEPDTVVSFDPTVFNTEKPDISGEGPAPFDYAYCATCHKCQGSEYAKVLVLEQVCRAWDHKRWAYTAASRAKDELYWVANY